MNEPKLAIEEQQKLIEEQREHIEKMKNEVAAIDKKMGQLAAQKKALLQRNQTEERKARTRRLISIGAEVEAYCGKITDLEAFKAYLAKYNNAITATQLSADRQISGSENTSQ